MKKFKAFIFNHWTLAILALIAIAIIIYFVGPLITIAEWTPFASVLVRSLTILVITLVWLGIKLVRYIKAKNEELGFLENIFTKKPSDDDEIAKNERSTLELKFKEAFANLKKSSKNLGQKFDLYEIPWYIIIGPPGSGKTTALLNSGLKFPLSKEFGGGAVQGIGGTRNCDWWFTDQGIIIDTAGRYTTQDSHKEVDSSAWQEFLQLLKRFRKRRPINGVFVTISLQELLLQTEAQRVQHVAAISNRLQELKDVFQINFPVYVLITKADLVAGFEEYFDNFSKAERDQVWGVTFPFNKDGDAAAPLSVFSAEYDKLLHNLNDRLIPRLHQERDQQRAQKIGAFPKQLQSVKPLLEQFLVDIFENSRYSQDLMLRGCYFCSGTQEGTPIDRLMNKLSGPSSLAVSQNKGKSFFIKDLFENIVFVESGLVGTDVKLEKRLKVFNLAAISAISLTTLLFIGGWGLSYSKNLVLVDHSSSSLSELGVLIDKLPTSEHSAAKILPILDAARSLPVGYDDRLSSPPLLTQLGLYQGETVSDATLSIYQATLNKILLSRLIVQTESTIANSQFDDNYTYAALRTYLMLDSEEYYRSEDVSAFYHISWLRKAAQELTSEQYNSLSAHINVLFETRPVPLPVVLDAKLIKKAQFKLTKTPFERVIYSRLLQMDLPGLVPFTIYDHAGQQLAETVFIRKSGLPLNEGIEALYTKAAYTQIMGEEIEKLTEEVVQESWVYGESYQHTRAIDKDALVKAVKNLYRNDYIAKYQELLDDLDVAPFTNYEDAASVLSVLSGQTAPSPLQLLLQAVKEETELGVSQYTDGLADNAKLKQAQGKLERMLGGLPDIKVDGQFGAVEPITTAFKPLNRLVSAKAEGDPIPLDKILTQFSELYSFMTKATIASMDGALTPAMINIGEEKIQFTRQMAKGQPQLFISPYMEGVANRSGSLAFGGVMVHINQQWQLEPLEFCINAVKDHYPLDKNSQSEISLTDFGEFFGYGGIVDKFFTKHLNEYVDTTKAPWRIKSSHKALISVSSDALSAFERAHYIRKSFFQRGSKRPQTKFKLTPQELDGGLLGFYLNLDGQSISYEFGPLLNDQLTWPGPSIGAGASITLKQVDGNDISIYEEGDWAWFRILDKVQLSHVSNNTEYRVNFGTSGYTAYYTLKADGAYNPYRLKSRIQFTCPSAL
ncbi:MAG: type VI secretion system protein ImpL [Oleiphilaceae bacterium]|jgi:type VI secretion system protein ImpL